MLARLNNSLKNLADQLIEFFVFDWVEALAGNGKCGTLSVDDHAKLNALAKEMAKPARKESREATTSQGESPGW